MTDDRPLMAHIRGVADLERVAETLSSLIGQTIELHTEEGSPPVRGRAPITVRGAAVGWVSLSSVNSSTPNPLAPESAAEPVGQASAGELSDEQAIKVAALLSQYCGALAADTERLRGRILATVSHELRTPLTSVIGYAEMLLEGMAGDVLPSQRDYLETIVTKSQKLVQVISGIVELNVSDQQLILNREPVAIGELVRAVAARFSSQVAEPNQANEQPGFVHTVHTEVDCDPGLVVFADHAMVEQVITNLVANAIKFSPSGPEVTVVVDVGARICDGISSASTGALGVRIAVRDRGIGIAQADQARIFETFVQVDSSPSRRFEGAGLGLSVAKRFVEAHGGSIWVESALDDGAVFTFMLPLRSADISPDGKTAGDPTEDIAAEVQRESSPAVKPETTDRSCDY